MFEKIFKELKSLSNEEKLAKSPLLSLLQNLSKTISVYDQMNVTVRLKDNLKEVQGAYQEGFLEVYVKHFVMRIKDIREDKNVYKNETINKKEFIESIELLERQVKANKNEPDNDEKFRLIYIIISLYTTFILDEPIHPVGSPFPGGLTVEFKEGIYYCPVKENNKDNPKAVCKFCIAEQLPTN